MPETPAVNPPNPSLRTPAKAGGSNPSSLQPNRTAKFKTLLAATAYFAIAQTAPATAKTCVQLPTQDMKTCVADNLHTAGHAVVHTYNIAATKITTTTKSAWSHLHGE